MMKLARSRRRAAVALAGLAAVCGGAAQAADDKSTVGAVMELLGYSSDPSAASIDYRERPKLVLPPKIGELPPPRETASRPDGWPVDASTVRQRNSDRYARVPNAPPPEKSVGLIDRIRGVKPESSVSFAEEPNRRMLTEPPTGYRRPTKDLATIGDPEAKKGAWWNPMTYLGGGGAQQQQGAQPQKQAGAQPQKQASGESDSWFRMPRFVLKDPDKDKD